MQVYKTFALVGNHIGVFVSANDKNKSVYRFPFTNGVIVSVIIDPLIYTLEAMIVLPNDSNYIPLSDISLRSHYMSVYQLTTILDTVQTLSLRQNYPYKKINAIDDLYKDWFKP